MMVFGLNQTSKILVDYIERRVMPQGKAQSTVPQADKVPQTDKKDAWACPAEKTFL
jgi:hypothetical protein